MTSLPEISSFADFARIAHFKRSYITALKGEGRLVLTDDGKRVRVRESLELIKQTRDPSRLGVAQRHAAARAATLDETSSLSPQPPQQPQPQPQQQQQSNPDDQQSSGDADSFSGQSSAWPAEKNTSMYQHWRERAERAKALAAERENAVADGKLVDAAAVIDALKSHVAVLRTGLETLPDFLAPQIIGIKDENKIRALIVEAIEEKLADLAHQFGMIARADA